jgi:putative hydrolase of the HAD superfamily
MRDGAVIFDLDDTLYPYRAFVGSGFRAVAAAAERLYAVEAGLALRQLRRARVSGDIGRELQRLCVAHRLPPSALFELRQAMVEHRPSLRLPVTSRGVLDALRQRWRVGVLTNGEPAVQAAKIAALGVAPLVDAVVFACEHGDGSGKPAPEGFEEVLARLETPPARAVFVGNDPIADVAGAAAAGLHTIHLRRVSYTAAPHASACARSLREVPALAARLLAAKEPAHAV